MNIGVQIKKLRNELSFSQDDLAEKVYVSRQSISNWENDKTYPDIKSLILLSEVFNVSLDQLIKGDIEKMKQEIDEQEVKKFKKESTIFTIIFIAMILLPVPLAKYMGWTGILIYLVIWIACLLYGKQIEISKKKNNIKTYKEIVDFMNGKTLNEIEKSKEDAVWPYQNIIGLIGVVLIVVIIFWIMIYILY